MDRSDATVRPATTAPEAHPSTRTSAASVTSA